MIEKRGLVGVVVTLALFLAAACQSPTAGSRLRPIKGADPLQVMADSGPRLIPLDANRLLVVVFTEDSLLNVLWRPSHLEIETSRSYVGTAVLRPPACLIPVEGDYRFPYNFDWLICDAVAFNTTSVLSAARFKAIAQLASGDTLWSRVLAATPIPYYPDAVATYVVRVPLGLAATEDALRRIRAQGEVNYADRELNQPPCIMEFATVCPPWHVTAVLRVSFSDSPGVDDIPVDKGGSLWATYRQADGSSRRAEYVFRE